MKLPDRVLKPLVFLGCVEPLLMLGWRALHEKLGADPVALVLNKLGWWALFLLLATLACTPLQLAFGWNWPIRLRRMLGLFAFAYASLHLCTYVGLDQTFDFSEIAKDIAKRPFITVGFLAWLIMLPLAITSTSKMTARLGYGRWKQLHRLVYVSGVLGAIHFYWRVKADHREPLKFAYALAGLLAIRVVFALLPVKRGEARRGKAVVV